jgi:hypothetical protein
MPAPDPLIALLREWLAKADNGFDYRGSHAQIGEGLSDRYCLFSCPAMRREVYQSAARVPGDPLSQDSRHSRAEGAAAASIAPQVGPNDPGSADALRHGPALSPVRGRHLHALASRQRPCRLFLARRKDARIAPLASVVRPGERHFRRVFPRYLIDRVIPGLGQVRPRRDDRTPRRPETHLYHRPSGAA